MARFFTDFQLLPMQMLVLIAAFGLTLSLWLIGVMFLVMRNTRRQQHLNKRLGLDRPGIPQHHELYLWVDGRLASTSVPNKAQARLRSHIQHLAEKAGWNSSPGAIVLTALGLMSLGGGAALLWSHSAIVTGVTVLCVGYGLLCYTERCIAYRESLFENQMVDALGLATRSLRAGHPLIGAFQLIAQELDPPIRNIFGEICQQQELGKSLDEALTHSLNKVDSKDMKFFATAVVIQLRSGGNLADMMERLTVVIRERMRLARRARVLTAEVKLSKNVLIALPFVLFLIISMLSPEFSGRLTESQSGRMMLGGACLSMMVGAWIIRKISILRY